MEQDEIDKKILDIWHKFLSSASQIDLLRSVQTFNYDDVRDDHPLVKKILTDKTVDKAVALAFYWYNSPRYLKQYASIEEAPDWLKDSYLLCETLEKQLTGGFYTVSNIYYDPKHDGIDNWPSSYLEYDPDRKLPKILEEAVDGEFFFESPYDSFEDGLPFDLVEEIYALYD